jgi:hypothetical protein
VLDVAVVEAKDAVINLAAEFFLHVLPSVPDGVTRGERILFKEMTEKLVLPKGSSDVFFHALNLQYAGPEVHSRWKKIRH